MKKSEEMSDADFLDMQWKQSKKELRRVRRKERVRFILLVLCGWAWLAFCVFGALGLVGTELPWLAVLLATGVFGLGVFVAVRLWDRHNAESDI